MVFWGIEVKPGELFEQLPSEFFGSQLHLSQATLGMSPKASERVVVKARVGDSPSEVFLCSLTAGRSESCPLDLLFNEPVVFSVSGSTSVHLTGYYMPTHEEEGEMYEEDEEEEDSEDEGMMMGDEFSDSEEEGDEEEEGGVFLGSGMPRATSSVVITEIDNTEDADVAPASKADARLLEGSSITAADATQSAKKKQKQKGKRKEGVEVEGEGRTATAAAGGKAEEMNKTPEKGRPGSAGKLQEEQEKKDAAAAEEQKAETPGTAGRKKRKQLQREQEQQQQKKAEEGKVGTPGAVFGEAAQPKQQAKKQKKEEQQQQQQQKVEEKQKAGKEQQAKKAPAGEKEAAGGGKGGGKLPAVRTFPNGLEVTSVAMGKPGGKLAAMGKKVVMNYIGKLKDGKVFDSTVGKKPFLFRLGVGEVIKGWDIGVQGMRVGDKRKLKIPPKLGYGPEGVRGAIPPNAWLTFDVELVDVK